MMSYCLASRVFTWIRNWVPKFVSCKILGYPSFQERPQYTQITTVNMYLLIEIRHNCLIQCRGNHIEVAKNSIYA